MSEAIIIAAAGLAGGIVSQILSWFVQRRKMEAETKHSEIDATGDAYAVARSIFKDRIDILDAQVEDLRKEIELLKQERKVEQQERQAERAGYEATIKDVNQRLGQMMQAAEELGRAVKILRARLDEVLDLLRAAGGKLPDWAQHEA